MKYFQSQEILTTTPPPGRKIFDDEWICPPRNYSMFFCPPPVQVWEALPLRDMVALFLQYLEPRLIYLAR